MGFLLELFPVRAGFDLDPVNENCAGVQHLVVQSLVENMLKYFAGQLIREALAESIAHCCKAENIIQQPIPKKSAVRVRVPNPLVALPQRRNAEQVLKEHHLDQHNRIGSGASVVMAIVRSQPFIQPFIIHALFYFSKQMVFRDRCIQIYNDWLAPCVSSPAFHENIPVSSIMAETRAVG